MAYRNNKTIIEIITALTNEFAEEIRVDDVVALFEDIIKHFHKNELDLIQLGALNHDQKTELYTEIKKIIYYNYMDCKVIVDILEMLETMI